MFSQVFCSSPQQVTALHLEMVCSNTSVVFASFAIAISFFLKALPYFQTPAIISCPALSSSQLLHTYKLFKGLEPDIPFLWLSGNASDRLTDAAILLRAEVNLIYISFSSTARLSSRLPFSSSFRSLPDFPKGRLSTFSQLSWTRYDTSVFFKSFL